MQSANIRQIKAALVERGCPVPYDLTGKSGGRKCWEPHSKTRATDVHWERS